MEFKKFLEKNQVMETFDKTVFKSVIEKVIVEGKNNDGNDDSYKLTFVYKTGISNQVNAPKKRTKITESMKDNLSKLSSSCTDEVEKMFPLVQPTKVVNKMFIHVIIMIILIYHMNMSLLY